MINLEDKTQHANNGATDNGAHEQVTALNGETTFAIGNKSFKSQTGNVSTHSRVTTRRVSKTSRVNVQTGTKVALVHSTTVTTSRSWSSPRVENLTANENGHTELSFDLFNQIPTSSDVFGWVNNLDSFIKDQNVGLDEQQVGTKNSSCTCGADGEKISTVDSGFNDKASEESYERPTRNKCTCGAELLEVSHSIIFSHSEASQ